MKNFNGSNNRDGGFRGGDRGGKPSFQNKSWGVDRGGERDKPMFKATCSECGKACEVPFRPTGDKPVFCSDCFNKKRDATDTRGGGRPDFNDRGPKRDFNDRHAPRPDFSRSEPRAPYKPSSVNDDTKKQLSDISFKLDKLISAVEKMTTSKSVATISPKVEVKKEIATKVVVKKSEPKVTKKKVVAKKKK